MKDVTNKINELVALLEEKNSVTDVLNKQLSVMKLALEEEEIKAVARSKHLSAMERIYKKYEDFDNEKKKFEDSVKAMNVRIEKAKKQEENDTETLNKINEENKKLDARKLAMTKQAVALKEKEANFDKKKEDLKAMISGQSIKDMLK